MKKGRPPRGEAGIGRAMTRGAALPAACSGVVCTAVGAGFGAPQAAGGAVGAVLALAVAVVGPLVMRTFAHCSPPAVMAAAVSSYLVVVLVMGAAYLALGAVPGVSQTAVGLALLAGVMAAIGGQAWVVWHARLIAYDPAHGDVAGSRPSRER